MFDKDLVRTLSIAGICLVLPVYNWHYIVAPSHRAITLLTLSVVLSGCLS